MEVFEKKAVGWSEAPGWARLGYQKQIQDMFYDSFPECFLRN